MMSYRFRCECGCEFDEPKEVRESRGEFWGMPAYETMYYCPKCGDTCFDEITDDDADSYEVVLFDFDENGEFLGTEKSVDEFDTYKEANDFIKQNYSKLMFGDEVEIRAIY